MESKKELTFKKRHNLFYKGLEKYNEELNIVSVLDLLRKLRLIISATFEPQEQKIMQFSQINNIIVKSEKPNESFTIPKLVGTSDTELKQFKRDIKQLRNEDNIRSDFTKRIKQLLLGVYNEEYISKLIDHNSSDSDTNYPSQNSAAQSPIPKLLGDLNVANISVDDSREPTIHKYRNE